MIDKVYGPTRVISTAGYKITLVWRYDLKRWEIVGKEIV